MESGTPQLGDRFRGKRILDSVKLSNGWVILKTEDSKSTKDFKVKTIYQTKPRIRSYTPKHAHFAIDLYGKICADREKAKKVFDAIIEVWSGKPPNQVIARHNVQGLPGYDLEYVLYALNWILEQEDINFKGRPLKKQQEIDDLLRQLGVNTPSGRAGSELAISLLCNIVLGVHPVEAFMRANLDVLPVKRARGAL
ncbi:MAG: hypothetical protein QXX17_00055 [Conexivisphaerales archaeon]